MKIGFLTLPFHITIIHGNIPKYLLFSIYNNTKHVYIKATIDKELIIRVMCKHDGNKLCTYTTLLYITFIKVNLGQSLGLWRTFPIPECCQGVAAGTWRAQPRIQNVSLSTLETYMLPVPPGWDWTGVRSGVLEFVWRYPESSKNKLFSIFNSTSNFRCSFDGVIWTVNA